MDKRAKVALALGATAIVAYALGHQRATSQLIREFGTSTSKEALIYLATQDAIRNRFR